MSNPMDPNIEDIKDISIRLLLKVGIMFAYARYSYQLVYVQQQQKKNPNTCHWGMYTFSGVSKIDVKTDV